MWNRCGTGGVAYPGGFDPRHAASPMGAGTGCHNTTFSLNGRTRRAQNSLLLTTNIKDFTNQTDRLLAAKENNMKYKEINKVYETVNYGIFKNLKGNRQVEKLRKKRLNESFDKVGLIKAPIIVNEKMEIIDGQGRFEACKERGLPIVFQIIEGIGDKECICMNTGTMNWSIPDYVNFYAEKGLKDYQEIKALSTKYKNIPLSSLIPLSKGLSANTKGGDNQIDVKQGFFKITQDLDELEEQLVYINELVPYCKKSSRATSIVPVLSMCYLNKNIDRSLLRKKILDNYKVMTPSQDIPRFCSSLSEIYNRNKRGKIISFEAEYINSMREPVKNMIMGKYDWGTSFNN